jgi:hypothetical protein
MASPRKPSARSSPRARRRTRTLRRGRPQDGRPAVVAPQSPNENLKENPQDKLERLWHSTLPHDVIWHFDVGECINALYSGDRQYREKKLLNIAAMLGATKPRKTRKPRSKKRSESQMESKSLLRACQLFAKTYTRKKVDSLIKRSKREGGELRWSHFNLLMRIQDSQKRREIEDLCIAKRWPVAQLLPRVHRATEDPGRRGPRIPPSVTRGAKALSQAGSRFLWVSEAMLSSEAETKWLESIEDEKTRKVQARLNRARLVEILSDVEDKIQNLVAGKTKAADPSKKPGPLKKAAPRRRLPGQARTRRRRPS